MKKTKILALVFFVAACCYAIGTINHIVNTGEGILSSSLFAIAISLESYRNEVLYKGQKFNIGAIPMIMLFNPYSPIVDFFIRTVSDSSLLKVIESSSQQKISKVYVVIYQLWIPISIIINLLISYLFLKLASVNIAVTKNKKKK